MQRIANEFDSNNFASMAQTTRKFMKVCRYGGIPRVYCLSEYISKACKEGKYHRVIDYYPNLVEAVIEYKKAWRAKREKLGDNFDLKNEENNNNNSDNE